MRDSPGSGRMVAGEAARYACRNLCQSRGKSSRRHLIRSGATPASVRRFSLERTAHTVATSLFSLVERRVSGSEQVGAGLARAKHGDTEADSDGNRRAVEGKSCAFDGLPHGLGDALGIALVAVAQNNQEFLAAPAADMIRRTQAGADCIGTTDRKSTRLTSHH